MNEHEHHHHEENCSCGHEHHHHDENCSCGHEHHHHDENCSCGHEHHHHDENCSCGHEHHHHDENCSCGHEHHHHKHYHGAGQIYLLENLGCAHCAAKMEEKINELPGVTAATIIYATKQLRISGEHVDDLLPEIQKICSSIESQVKVVPSNTHTPSATHEHAHAPSHKENHMDLFQILLGAALFIIGIILDKYNISEAAALTIFIVGYLLLGGKILLEAARNILHGQIFDENFLMCIATLGAFAIQEYPEAIGVMLFYRIGELFEQKAVSRSRSQIMDAIDLRPEVVTVLSDGKPTILPTEDVSVNDLLLIHPGDRIPLDGVIVDGSSRLDTSPLTGEPVPVSVSVGDEILSGCVNTSGLLQMRVTKPLEESMVSRILESVENAAANKPKIDRFITRFAKIHTPVVVFGAAAVAIFPSLITGNWKYWIYTALTFLVMSCPCALVLSVPLAFFSGIGFASKKGILFKGGSSIEALNQIKAVVMDKTGTITQGNFTLQKVVTAGSLNADELLRLCASCEQNSTHPIAHSIVSAARAKGLTLSVPESLKEFAGHGIAANLSEGEILCGNRRLMEQHHIFISDVPEESYGSEVFVAINHTFAGYLLISDTVKSDAASAIQRLKSYGLHTCMLTGDSLSSAKAIAAKTGIDEVHAKLLPQDKLKLLTQIRNKYGSVLFVGDGINDAPVLAGADVGAAMGSGTDAAIEAADAVFMNSSVESVPEAISIAKYTNRITLQNIIFALVIKIAVMILGLCGFANMWMAVFADTGVAIICIVNSIRILYRK